MTKFYCQTYSVFTHLTSGHIWLMKQNNVFALQKSQTPTGLIWYTNVTDMTSRENALSVKILFVIKYFKVIAECIGNKDVVVVNEMKSCQGKNVPFKL